MLDTYRDTWNYLSIKGINATSGYRIDRGKAPQQKGSEMATKVISQEIVTETVVFRGNVAKAAQALVEARALKAQAEKAEAEARAIVIEALQAVGATKGTVKNITVTLRGETQSRIDSKGLRETYPEIAEAFTKAISITKVITN